MSSTSRIDREGSALRHAAALLIYKHDLLTMNVRLRSSCASILLCLLLVGCGGGGGDNGSSSSPGTPSGFVLDLRHEGIAFDESRQVYYASVSSADPVRGNRIATLDRTGSITAISEPVGSNPTAVAVSKDGSRLYVALGGSGEVIQLSLPAFLPLGRVALPADQFSGQTYAEQIAVSPTEPDTIAVSLAYDGVFPRHAGVAIARNMVLLPTRTPRHTGSNRIGFAASGDSVYGFNNESTEFGVRRLSVIEDGISESTVVPVTEADFGWKIDVSQNLVMVGNRAFAIGTLAPQGVVDGASFHCVVITSGSRVACFSIDYGKLIVAEAANFTRLGEVAFPETPSTSAVTLVAGPSGQVVASAVASGKIYFVDSQLLR